MDKSRKKGYNSYSLKKKSNLPSKPVNKPNSLKKISNKDYSIIYKGFLNELEEGNVETKKAIIEAMIN